MQRHALLLCVCFLLCLGYCHQKQPIDPAHRSSPLIIDHTCTDISQISSSWLQKVRDTFRLHYAHTSHGEQITVGLERLASQNPDLPFSRTDCALPGQANTLNMLDGQVGEDYCETYVTPDLYWESSFGLELTRYVLNSFAVNVSGWCWCTQLDYYDEAEVSGYLNQINALEQQFPQVTFVYFTGNAQSQEANRHLRNEQIRKFCRENNKVLFDFGDLDSWYNGEQWAVDGIPMEHPHYHGDEAGHTTYESCENKARAWWWLLARLAGWAG